MSKDTTAKAPAKQKGSASAQRRARFQPLADHIAAVMCDPRTPANLHNAMLDALDELRDDTRSRGTPEVLRAELPLVLEKLEAADEPVDERDEPDDAPDERQPKDYARIASLVADLLTDDDTPLVLNQVLDRFCMELQNRFARNGECVCSPETTRKNLPALLERADFARVLCDDVVLDYSLADKEVRADG